MFFRIDTKFAKTCLILSILEALYWEKSKYNQRERRNIHRKKLLTFFRK